MNRLKDYKITLPAIITVVGYSSYFYLHLQCGLTAYMTGKRSKLR